MDVDGLFLNRTTRRVRRDATISLNGRLFEVPVSLRGRVVEVRFDPFSYRRLEVYLDAKKVGDGVLLDKELNSRTFRLQNYEHNR